jgi:hypothetical protein
LRNSLRVLLEGSCQLWIALCHLLKHLRVLCQSCGNRPELRAVHPWHSTTAWHRRKSSTSTCTCASTNLITAHLYETWQILSERLQKLWVLWPEGGKHPGQAGGISDHTLCQGSPSRVLPEISDH